MKDFLKTLDFWDWVTFGVLFSSTFLFLIFLVLILTLPGRIALARNHPDAEAVRLMGLVGFAAVVPWIQALIWAYRPTEKIDIRRLPREELAETERELQRLREERGNLIPARKGAPKVRKSRTAPKDEGAGE